MSAPDVIPDGVPEPVIHGPERWCAALEAFCRTLAENGDTEVLNAFRVIRGRLGKSSLGRRLFYEGEKVRTEKCPYHEGRWSGMFMDIPPGCKCMRFNGDEATGWIPGPESNPANNHNPVMLGTIRDGRFIPTNPAIEPMSMRPVDPKDAAP